MSNKESPSVSKPQQTISHLQKGVLRLALSFRGQHGELDERLKDLSRLAGSGRKGDELAQLIDDIIDIIVGQNLDQNPKQKGGNSLNKLIDFLSERSIESPGLAGLKQKLDLPVDELRFQQLVEELATEIAAVTNKLPDEISVVGLPEVLAKLQLGANFDKEIGEISSHLAACKNRYALLDYADRVAEIVNTALAQQAGGTQNESTDIGEYRDQLLLLMDLINVPKSFADAAAKVCVQIERAESAVELYTAIPAIAEMTGAVRQSLEREIDELSGFLNSLHDRLIEFDNLIKDAGTFHETSVEETITFSNTMNEQVEVLQLDIDSADDVNEIRRLVSSRVETLDSNLRQYVEGQNKRHQDAHKRVEQMVTTLNVLENETEDLRQNLEETHHQISLDPLTGIFNRFGYNQNITAEFSRWERYGHELSIAILDLDLFKNINDRYGHAAGDRVLATVAAQIESQIRESDIICPYGGEEFVVIMPETDIDGAVGLVEKLRIYIEQCKFHFKQEPVPVTLSAGIAHFLQGDTVDDVFERADQAMYVAKRSGRNQCRAAEEAVA